MRDRPVEVSISAKELRAAYSEYAAGAPSRYHGKVLEVTGVVRGAGRNSRGILFLTLETGVTGWGLTCYCLETEADILAGLTKGQAVRVKGRDDTLVPLAILRDCIVVGAGQSEQRGDRPEPEPIFVDIATESPGHGDLFQAQLLSVNAEMSVGKGEPTADLDQEILSHIDRAVETGLSPEDEAQTRLLRGGVFQRQSRPIEAVAEYASGSTFLY